MSKLDQLSEEIKQDIKVLMIDTLLEAVKESKDLSELGEIFTRKVNEL